MKSWTSKPEKNGWRTTIRIRNNGDITVTRYSPKHPENSHFLQLHSYKELKKLRTLLGEAIDNKEQIAFTDTYKSLLKMKGPKRFINISEIV